MFVKLVSEEKVFDFWNLWTRKGHVSVISSLEGPTKASRLPEAAIDLYENFGEYFEGYKRNRRLASWAQSHLRVRGMSSTEIPLKKEKSVDREPQPRVQLRRGVWLSQGSKASFFIIDIF